MRNSDEGQRRIFSTGRAPSEPVLRSANAAPCGAGFIGGGHGRARRDVRARNGADHLRVRAERARRCDVSAGSADRPTLASGCARSYGRPAVGTGGTSGVADRGMRGVAAGAMAVGAAAVGAAAGSAAAACTTGTGGSPCRAR